MKSKEEHIGKKAILIEDMGSLLEGSYVFLRATNGSMYVTEIIRDSNNKNIGHNCGGFFDCPIGWNIDAAYLEIIEEKEEIEEASVEDDYIVLEDDIDIPTGL